MSCPIKYFMSHPGHVSLEGLQSNCVRLLCGVLHALEQSAHARSLPGRPDLYSRRCEVTASPANVAWAVFAYT